MFDAVWMVEVDWHCILLVTVASPTELEYFVRYIEWASGARYALTFVIKRQLNSLTAATVSEEKRSHLLSGRG